MNGNIFDHLLFNSNKKMYPGICKIIEKCMLSKMDMSATHIISKTFSLLLDKHYEELKSGSVYLASEDTDLDEEVYCFHGFTLGDSAQISDWMFSDTNGLDVICDILKPNLYCVLLIEMIGKNIQGPIPLNKLKDKYYQPLDDAQQVKSLPELFSDEWKDLFLIEQERKGTQYQISTPYQELLSAMIQDYRISPLNTEKSRYSFQYNRRFYEACVKSINKNTQTDLHMRTAQHYLLERIFRFSTKYTLFSSSSNSLEEPKLSCQSSCQPAILADFFLSSPLAFFPRKMLASLFCKTYDLQVQMLHFFIQLSSIRFWLILDVLRDYIRIQNITLKGFRQFFLFT